MKILLTGSHFTPAQAVIEELQKNKITDIVYVGRRHTLEGDKNHSVESQVLPTLGVKFIPITTGRLRRFLSIQTITSLFKIPIGFVQSLWVLSKEQPDIIVSFGGYVAVPTVVSGWLLSIPILVHEQTLVSGFANTISNIFADKIAVSFDKEYNFAKNKTLLTGNPMRQEVLAPQDVDKDIREFVLKSKKDKKPIIFVTGGNQGSHIINEVVGQTLESLLELGFVIHQTGESRYNDFDKLSSKKEQLKNSQRYLPKKWVSASDMGYILKNCQLVIARGGINTLLELAFYGVPTIVVPIDYLYKDEQNVNANFFQNAGLCRIISQNKLSQITLKEAVADTLDNYEKYKNSASNAKKEVILNASKKLTQQILIMGEENV